MFLLWRNLEFLPLMTPLLGLLGGKVLFQSVFVRNNRSNPSCLTLGTKELQQQQSLLRLFRVLSQHKPVVLVLIRILQNVLINSPVKLGMAR